MSVSPADHPGETPARAAVLTLLADRITDLGPSARVAVGGRPGAGGRALAGRLTAVLTRRGRAVRRARADSPTSTPTVPAPGTILVVDGVFALRPGLNDLWDHRVWLEIDAGLSARRGGARPPRLREVERFVRAADPASLADIVIDMTDPAAPEVVDWPGRRPAADDDPLAMVFGGLRR